MRVASRFLIPILAIVWVALMAVLSPRAAAESHTVSSALPGMHHLSESTSMATWPRPGSK